MNGVKAAAKAIAATAAGALMLGTTVAGAAFAADFGSFPAPFVKDGAFNGKVVVGANAATADVVGAIGIAAALGQATVQLSDATGSGKATVSVASADGIKGEVALGEDLYDASDLSGKVPIKTNRFAALKKWTGSDLKYKDTTTEIAAHQEIDFDTTGIMVGHGDSDAAAGKFYLKIPSSELKVRMVFDDTFNETTGDVVFDLFGKEITLEAVGTDSVTVSSGSKYSVSLDNPTFTDSTTGATITFKGVNTDSNKAYVTVTNGGQTETAVLDDDVSKTVAGIELKATDLFRMSDTSMFGSVTVGSKLSDEITTGEKFLGAADWELFEVGDVGAATGLNNFTVAYTPSAAKYLAVGESLTGLFGGFDVLVQSAVVPASGYTDKLTVTLDSSPNIFRDATTKDTSAKGLKFAFPKADVAQLNNGTDIRNDGTTAVYLDTAYSTPGMLATLTFYPDTTDASAASAVVNTTVTPYLFNLTYGDTKVVFSYVNTTVDQIRVDFADAQATKDDYFVFNVTLSSFNLETIAQGSGNDAEASDMRYVGDVYTPTIGTNEYEYTTEYGVKIDAPKTDLKNEKVAFAVPTEPQKYVVVVGKDRTVQEQIAAGQTGALSKVKVDAISVEGAKKASIVPITAPVAVLDTEVTDTNMNLVLVGGPSVNKIVKGLGGMYADANTYKDVGKLFWHEASGFTHVVVAGWDADNTRAAAYVLAHYDANKAALAGKTEVTVEGKDVNSLTVA